MTGYNDSDGSIDKESFMETVLLIIACLGIAFFISQGRLLSPVRGRIRGMTKPTQEQVEAWRKRVEEGDHTPMRVTPSPRQLCWQILYMFLNTPPAVAFVVGAVAYWCGLDALKLSNPIVGSVMTGFMLSGICHIIGVLGVGISKPSSSGGCGGKNHQQHGPQDVPPELRRVFERQAKQFEQQEKASHGWVDPNDK